MTRQVVEHANVGSWRTAIAQLEGTCAPKTGQTGQTGQRVGGGGVFGAFYGQKPRSHDPQLARARGLRRNSGEAGLSGPIDAVERVLQL